MRKRYIKLGGAVLLAVTASVAAVVYTNPMTPSQPLTTLAALSSVSALELPSVAAKIVRDAKPENREAVAKEVIQATVALARPGVLPYVVSAVCQAVPDMASVVATTSAHFQPSEAVASTKSAAAAAPESAEQIVYSVTREVPHMYAPVAVAASQAAPAKTRVILNAVNKALPEMEPYINSAVARNGAEQANIVTILQQSQTQYAAVLKQQSLENKYIASVANSPSAAFVSQPAPRVTPPFTDPIGIPAVIKVENTVVSPGGTRDYSAP